MEVRTARYKLRPTRAQYAALRGVRVHLCGLRNACLQELKDSYRTACRFASRRGRDRPAPDDWMAVRGEEIADFMAWQAMKESELRARHDRAEHRRIKGLRPGSYANEAGIDLIDLTPRRWRPKDASAFGCAITKAD